MPARDVRREALAVILPIVGIGLARSAIEALADLEDVMAHLKAALADGAADGDPGMAPDSS